MPPADRAVLPSSILLALGLGACTGVKTEDDTGTAYLGPCLTVADTWSDSDHTSDSWSDNTNDSDTDTDTDSDTDTDTDSDTDSDSDTDTGTDTGTIGPCLSPEPPDSGTTPYSTGDTGTPTLPPPPPPPPVPSRSTLLDRLETSGLLPADVLARLKDKAR